MERISQATKYIGTIGTENGVKLTKNQKKTDIVVSASGEVLAKRCNECKELKLRKDMAKASAKKDGMAIVCKECKRQAYQPKVRQISTEAMKEINEFISKTLGDVTCYEIVKNQLDTEIVKDIATGEVVVKRCSKCGELKLRKDMAKQKSNNDGMSYVCKTCNNKRTCVWGRENPERRQIHDGNRKAMKKALPFDFTPEQYEINCERFGNVCPLSGASIESCDLEHLLPLSIGHGGTTLTNCYPLRSDLNLSKHNRNIFEWFERFQAEKNLSKEGFADLISYMAELNGLTVEAYRDFIYWCHANPRTKEEAAAAKLTSVEIWKEATKAIAI